MKNSIKLSIAIIITAVILGGSFRTTAYPPYLRAAQKFGAKNCMFCHEKAEGGEGWNARGNWLIAEKEKRKADAVDVEWLADYKEADKKDDDKDDKKDTKEEGKKKEKP